MNTVLALAGVVACYLIGSIPVAYILVKLIKGIDVRDIGSGNVGATNASRALGTWAFFVVLVLDCLKGYLPVSLLLAYCYSSSVSPDFALLGALAVVLGHAFPLYLNFKGGKGVATGLGVFLALAIQPVLIGIIVFIVSLAIWRMVSLGSILAAIAISVSVFFLSDWHELWYFTWIIALFVIIKHRSNINRIFSGTENKFKLKK